VTPCSVLGAVERGGVSMQGLVQGGCDPRAGCWGLYKEGETPRWGLYKEGVTPRQGVGGCVRRGRPHAGGCTRRGDPVQGAGGCTRSSFPTWPSHWQR